MLNENHRHKISALNTKITSKIIIFAVLTIISLVCSWELAQSASSSNPIVWTAPSLQRIALREKNDSETSTSIQLFSARGEYESFQIGIRASQNDLTNVDISVSDLRSSNDRVISKSNISLYREYYVPVNKSSPVDEEEANPPVSPGWYPDALIPFTNPQTGEDLVGESLDAVPFDLSAGKNRPIWIDIFVPRDTSPGTYTGTYTVSSDQGNLKGNISLKVWNFELPVKPSLNSEFGLYSIRDKKTIKELLKHKVMPSAKVGLAYQRDLIDYWGLKSSRLPFWSGANYENREMSPPPSVSEIESEIEDYESDLFLYARFADEINGSPELNESIKKWARNFHQAGASTAIAMAPIPELYDNGSGTGRSAVDIWIVRPIDYDKSKSRVEEVLEKGDKVWFYTALAPNDDSPKWLLDFEPINFRIPHGFINQSLGMSGVLYWRVDDWRGDPWEDEQVLLHGEHYYPGEGMLVYPGEKVGVDGVVPSMRLKWIRDGVEDYEYVQILKDLGQTDLALEITRKAGQDWQNWTQDVSVLESARKELGEEIHRLSS